MVAYYAAVNAIDFYCYLRSVYWRLNISSRLQYRIGYVMWVAVQCVLKSKCISLWLRFFCVCLFISYIASLVREMCNVVQHLLHAWQMRFYRRSTHTQTQTHGKWRCYSILKLKNASLFAKVTRKKCQCKKGEKKVFENYHTMGKTAFRRGVSCIDIEWARAHGHAQNKK